MADTCSRYISASGLTSLAAWHTKAKTTVYSVRTTLNLVLSEYRAPAWSREVMRLGCMSEQVTLAV